jgi:beta-lysine 5,6-aminomutase alpha subunit
MGIEWEGLLGRTTFIIGADKNCGKTTFMKEAISGLRSSGASVAYLSAGVDGEALDYVTGAPKPSVIVEEGDRLVTAESALSESEADFEVLELVGEETVLGRQAIARAKSRGRVELVGPVGNLELAEVLEALSRVAPAEAVLVDGAVDRLTQVGAGFEAGYVLVLKVAGANFKRMVERARLALLLDSIPAVEHDDEGVQPIAGALTDARLEGIGEGTLVLEDFTRVFVDCWRMERLVAEREVRFARRFDLLGIVANLSGVTAEAFMEALGEGPGRDIVHFYTFRTAGVSPAPTDRTAGVSPASPSPPPSLKPKLHLPADTVERARALARRIAAPVQGFIAGHTTITVERATLRMLGADDVGPGGVPVPNIAVDSLRDELGGGAARWYLNALIQNGTTPASLNQAIAEGLDISSLDLAPAAAIEAKAADVVAEFDRRVSATVDRRNEMIEEYKANERSPLLYVIVATGNIYEDVRQAAAAAEQGADVVAVIRTTAQSLLDYVPFGATTEGFGGTYATQENFRIMREALDDVSRRARRYIRLVNYASGLCMPEIAAMGAFERLDMLLNDSMYGVLFRDINMNRTFVDQHFSRMINAFADILINTGEDNYLTTSDAYDKAYTVLASQFINERFALDAGLPRRLIGLGHAFEMDPELENGFLYEVAQAQMAREIFPECPLKYMPPTRFVTGDIFKAYAMNTLFNFASKATGQSIHLLGMLTEGIHTPFIQDRHLAVQNALYVMNNIASFYDEVEFRQDGLVAHRAAEVLEQAAEFLEEVAAAGLFSSIEQGKFADIGRARDGGKGADGVVPKAADYWNPIEQHLRGSGLES